MKQKIIKNLIFIFIITFIFISGAFALPVFASSTNGTIDSTDKYAWTENTGWLNFGTTEGNVHITDSSLTGYAWGENIGWIDLSPTYGGVSNDGEGNLSGYAWSENTGWVNFSPTYGGVTINSSGEFSGYAWNENTGWIVFNCATTSSCGAVDYKVKTDWRPQSVRPACNNTTDDDGDGLTDYPDDPGCDSLTDTDETGPCSGGIFGSAGGGAFVSEARYQIIHPDGTITYVEETKEVVEEVTKEPTRPSIIEYMPATLDFLVPDFLKPKPPKIKPEEIPIEELVPKETPLAMQNKWDLLPTKAIERFVLAPLPREIRVLAQKFPELEKTFEQIGVTKITDIEKLKTAELTLPGLEKLEEMPTEIVFAKTGGRLIDFSIALTVTEKGKPQQKITTVSGKPLQLAVKPDKPVKSIKGYIVFRSKAQMSLFQMPFSSLGASLFFARPAFARLQEKPVRVEERLVLLEFEYTDPDGDGVYTADIQVPLVEGEYEIITVMDFEDGELGKKEIRLITVVDPEGYIYEKIKNQELRITGAIVSIYWLNSETKQYELWLAEEYQQENPQITNTTGKYSFLVPEGNYYLNVEAPGYLVYDGKPFQVKEGRGVHVNIELKTKYWWLKVVDWKTILLVFVIILLLYNFYRDKIREKLLKSKNL